MPPLNDTDRLDTLASNLAPLSTKPLSGEYLLSRLGNQVDNQMKIQEAPACTNLILQDCTVVAQHLERARIQMSWSGIEPPSQSLHRFRAFPNGEKLRIKFNGAHMQSRLLTCIGGFTLSSPCGLKVTSVLPILLVPTKS
jgi:hypothetical protein